MSAPVIPGTCSRRDRYFTLVISKSFQSPPAGRHPPEEPNQRVRRNVSLPACSKGQTPLDVGGQVRSPPGNHSPSQPDAFLILSGERPSRELGSSPICATVFDPFPLLVYCLITRGTAHPHTPWQRKMSAAAIQSQK